MFKDLDTVALTRDLPEKSLVQGDIGAIVHVYQDGLAYEVEFVSLKGAALALVTVQADAIRPVENHEIAHVRQVA